MVQLFGKKDDDLNAHHAHDFPCIAAREKSIALCLRARTDHVKTDKPNDGERISRCACDLKTADAEYLLSQKNIKPVQAASISGM